MELPQLLKDHMIDFNMDVRSYVIKEVLQLEHFSTVVLKEILKLVKPDVKTLSNSSHALSFKNKMDLLLDFGDITKDEHKIFLKIMEIRNQFAHNPHANSFDCLDTYIDGLSSFLKKKYKEIFETNFTFEKQMNLCFDYVCHQSLNSLYRVFIEYRTGKSKQLRQYINDLILSDKSIYTEIFHKVRIEFEDFIKSKGFDINQQKEEYKKVFSYTQGLFYQKAINELFNKKLEELDVNDPAIYKSKIPLEELYETAKRQEEKEKGILRVGNKKFFLTAKDEKKAEDQNSEINSNVD